MVGEAERSQRPRAQPLKAEEQPFEEEYPSIVAMEAPEPAGG